MRETSMITRAADLAERLVEQVSEADHDWREVQRRAQALARLAARAQSSERDAAARRQRDPRRSLTC
jgi:flagellar biosynthesis chaperone FliJ